MAVRERITETPDARSIPGAAAQLYGALIGPLAFALDLIISYALVQHACSTGHHYVLHLMTVICLGLSLSGALISWQQWQQVRGVDDQEPHTDPVIARAHFLAMQGLLTSLGFTLVIIAFALPRFILSPCD